MSGDGLARGWKGGGSGIPTTWLSVHERSVQKCQRPPTPCCRSRNEEREAGDHRLRPSIDQRGQRAIEMLAMRLRLFIRLGQGTVGARSAPDFEAGAPHDGIGVIRYC